uniref:Uncharacterized protein n=1 Tax=Gasterosteus aculeatus aculeatus TaxID=481459 RepID=A0AAQ4QW93_GASAC
AEILFSSVQSLQKHSLTLTTETVHGNIHCKPGAAELLLQEVYSILTHWRTMMILEALDTSRPKSQTSLTTGRSTASKAFKNNLKMRELLVQPDVTTKERKARVLLQAAGARGRRPGPPESSPPVSHPVCAVLKFCRSSTWGGLSVSCKEIKVHRPARRSLLTIKANGDLCAFFCNVCVFMCHLMQ